MPAVHCLRCEFKGTSVRQVVNHMTVHGCESDFHKIMRDRSCVTSFRRHFAYRKHVYRMHEAILGINPTPNGRATGNDCADGSKERSPFPALKETNADSEDPSREGVVSDIQEQLVLF